MKFAVKAGLSGKHPYGDRFAATGVHHHPVVLSDEASRRGGKTPDFRGFLQIGAVSGWQLLASPAHCAGFSRSVSVGPKKFPKVGGGRVPIGCPNSCERFEVHALHAGKHADLPPSRRPKSRQLWTS